MVDRAGSAFVKIAAGAALRFSRVQARVAIVAAGLKVAGAVSSRIMLGDHWAGDGDMMSR